MPFDLPDVTDIVARALAEDLGVPPARLLDAASFGPDLLARDVTTSALVPAGAEFAGRIVAREACVVCGLPVAAAAFGRLAEAAGAPGGVDVFPTVAEGTRVEAGTSVAEVEGAAALVLSAERTALDFLMLLSGIATRTHEWRDAAGDSLLVVDTRKTVPGLRTLSKYAVRVAGGTNHREGLWDMVLVKDNHVRFAGDVGQAVARARAAHPHLVVEAEAESVAEAVAAVREGADMVLLDNMADSQLAEAVRAVRTAAAEVGRAVLTEASGTVDAARLSAIAAAGVDRVSASALTLAPPVDFGLDEA